MIKAPFISGFFTLKSSNTLIGAGVNVMDTTKCSNLLLWNHWSWPQKGVWEATVIARNNSNAEVFILTH
jgi:hypothetical protein